MIFYSIQKELFLCMRCLLRSVRMVPLLYELVFLNNFQVSLISR